MKEYEHKGIIIRIHDANIEAEQRRKILEQATIKFWQEAMKQGVHPESN